MFFLKLIIILKISFTNIIFRYSK